MKPITYLILAVITIIAVAVKLYRSHARLRKILTHIPTEAESGDLWREINTLRRNIREILRHPHKYVLIHGDDVIDYFGDYPKALGEGYRRFGLDDQFMVHEVDSLTRPPIWLPPGVIPVTLAEAATRRRTAYR
jgi:hypothetical protein